MTHPYQPSEKPALFAYQLLDHEGKPNGVWLGCTDEDVAHRSQVEGETHDVVDHFWSASQLAAEVHKAMSEAHAEGLTAALKIDADMRAAEVERAVAAERERCAKVCDAQADFSIFGMKAGLCASAARSCAEAIRKGADDATGT